MVLASGRSDDHVVVDWLRMSTDTRLSWNDFIDSGEGFTTRDLKLAEGLLAHVRDDRNNNHHHSQQLFLITQEQLNGVKGKERMEKARGNGKKGGKGD